MNTNITLMEYAESVTQRLAAFALNRQLAVEAGAFRTRADTLRLASEDLSALRAIEVTLRECGVAIPKALQSSQSLRSRVEKLRSAYEQDRNVILNSNPTLQQSVLGPTKVMCDELRQTLKDSWFTHVETLLGPMNEDLLRVLGQVPTIAAEVQTIRRIQEQARLIGSTIPPADKKIVEDTLATIGSLGGQKAYATERLEGIPSDVVAFLTRAMNGSAKLSELTPAVLEWLKDEQLLNAFKVVGSGY